MRIIYYFIAILILSLAIEALIDNLSDEMLTKIASSHSNESSEEENLK